MSIKCEVSKAKEEILHKASSLSPVQDDVHDATACAATLAASSVKKAAANDNDNSRGGSDSEIPPTKKRKTRRGKSKHHGDLSIDEELKRTDQASTSTVTRTRDSSFSMDSDGEFYSTPDDEEVFLIKDFDDQYESVQAERLQAMSKDELIKEYLMLEGKVELLTKRLRTNKHINGSVLLDAQDAPPKKLEVQREIQRLSVENDALKRENESLRAKLHFGSDSADSETDSSDTCSSTSSSNCKLNSEPPTNHKSQSTPTTTASTQSQPSTDQMPA